MESFASNSTSGFPSLRPHEALFAFIRPAKPLQPAVSPEQQQQPRRRDAPVCETLPSQRRPTGSADSAEPLWWSSSSSSNDDNTTTTTTSAIPAQLTGLFRQATPGTPLC